jgi:hypothetical protein
MPTEAQSFFWLLISDRLSTRSLLRRRGMDLDSFTCIFCLSLQEETVHHLFADCAFARFCWSSLNIDIPLGASFPDLCSQLRTQAPSLFSMETIILFCWAIWIIRNNWTFNGEQFSVRSVRDIFFREMNLKLRIKAGQENLLQSWISESSIASLLTLIFFFSFFVS